MNVDKILDRKYQMTDAGKIDTIRELYTVSAQMLIWKH